MAIRRAIRAAILLASGLLYACAQAPVIPSSDKPSSVPSTLPHPPPPFRVERARELEKQGDLHGAWLQWRILATRTPKRKDYRAQVSRLAERIAQATHIHMEAARQLIQQGQIQEARLALLRVLSLDPLHPEPIPLLRDMEANQLLELQAEKLRGYTFKRKPLEGDKSEAKQSKERKNTTPLGK